MVRLALPLLLLATAATGAASGQRAPQSDQAKITRELNGLTPRAPQRCVHTSFCSLGEFVPYTK